VVAYNKHIKNRSTSLRWTSLTLRLLCGRYLLANIAELMPIPKQKIALAQFHQREGSSTINGAFIATIAKHIITGKILNIVYSPSWTQITMIFNLTGHSQALCLNFGVPQVKSGVRRTRNPA